MKRYRFTWVDDKKEKVEKFRSVLESGPSDGSSKAALELVHVRKDFLPELVAWFQNNEAAPPHLLLIDHVFSPAQAFKLSGASVAHLLRTSFPTVPMICVTAMLDKDDAFDQEDLSEYTAIFAYTNLEKSLDDIFAIARDFPKLHNSEDIRAHVINCLRAPKKDAGDLARLLPEEFRSQRHATTEHRIARWIYSVLFRRPGFLYDRLRTATLLGLTVDGFEKVERLFERAKYKGVFANPSREMWWVSEVRRLLYSLISEDAPDIPQLAGRTLPGIKPQDFSVCYVSNRASPPPTSVAYVDLTRAAKAYPVCAEFAQNSPKEIGGAPGFEVRKVLKRGGQ